MAFLLGAKDDLYTEAFSLSGLGDRMSGLTIEGGSSRGREGGEGGEESGDDVADTDAGIDVVWTLSSCRSRNVSAARASASGSSS